jgi:indolepyruvate ferredoxin oxidoreductase
VLLEQGVKEVLITTDNPRAYRHGTLPRGVQVWSRERIVEAQEHLATVPGVTVLIHEQACAAELRRQRKRGLVATPTQRVVINHRICEGCGDCGRVSNCLSVQPFDTPFGRKTHIDQTMCNLDYSCLEGDCPAFVTIETKARPRWWPTRRVRPSKSVAEAPARDAAIEALLASPLPAPEVVIEPHDITIRMVGIGGTGVVTAAQVIGTAAMLAGYRVRGLDQVGLSQKAGPVVSDLHLTLDHDAESNRLGAGQADVLLVFDALVAASHLGTKPADPERTVVVGSSSSTPPGALITHPDTPMPSFTDLEAVLGQVTRRDRAHWADAEHLTHTALGDATTANVFVVGMALQAGALPIDPEYVEQALELNAVQVETNLAALRLGRRVIADPDAVARATHSEPGAPRDTGATVDFFAADLVEYQDVRYADDFRAFVGQVADAERAVAPTSSALTLAVARNLYKLMAYKDEYEVARLMLDDDAMAEAHAVANGRGRVAYRLHPPLLRELGVDHKLTFGLWTRPLFRWLARGKRLRGTVLDPFRWTKVRRAERALPGEYRAAMTKVLAALTDANLDTAVRIAELPDLVRGYEALKLERVAEFRRRLAADVRAGTAGAGSTRRR